MSEKKEYKITEEMEELWDERDALISLSEISIGKIFSTKKAIKLRSKAIKITIKEFIRFEIGS